MVVVALWVIGRAVFGDRFDVAQVIAWLRAAGSGALAVPLFATLFGVATTLLLPAMAMMAAAGATWGFFPGWVIGWACANLWAWGGFAVGRAFGAGRLDAWLANKGGGFVEKELKDGGVLATVMLRQLPLPYVGVNVGAGLTGLSWRDWILGNAIGLLPNCLIYTSLASAIVEGAAGAKEDAALRALLSAGGVLMLSLGTRWLRKRLQMSEPPDKRPAA